MMKFFKKIDREFGIMNRMRGFPPKGFDLDGEKELDWSWCLFHLPRSPRLQVLDIGCREAPILPMAVALGHEVSGVDMFPLRYKTEGFDFYRGNFIDLIFSTEFDLIFLCSVIEHIGLAGKYNQRSDENGDLKAMEKVSRLLKPNGKLVLTIPVGKDMVFTPYHRIYGKKRLPILLDKYNIESSQFYIKEENDVWKKTSEGKAMTLDRNGISYGLGQYVLRRKAF